MAVKHCLEVKQRSTYVGMHNHTHAHAYTPADAEATPASSESGGAQASQQQPSTSGKGGSKDKASDKEAGPSEQQQLDALLVMDFRVGKILSCEKHPEADR